MGFLIFFDYIPDDRQRTRVLLGEPVKGGMLLDGFRPAPVDDPVSEINDAHARVIC